MLPQYALQIYHIVGETAGYSPDLRVKFGLAGNLAPDAIGSYNSSCEANAIFIYLGIVADIWGISKMNGKIIGFSGG